MLSEKLLERRHRRRLPRKGQGENSVRFIAAVLKLRTRTPFGLGNAGESKGVQLGSLFGVAEEDCRRDCRRRTRLLPILSLQKRVAGLKGALCALETKRTLQVNSKCSPNAPQRELHWRVSKARKMNLSSGNGFRTKRNSLSREIKIYPKKLTEFDDEQVSDETTKNRSKTENSFLENQL